MRHLIDEREVAMATSSSMAGIEPNQRLLYTRKQARELLGGISVFTLIRLEREGRLKPIRLSRSPTSQAYYVHDDLIALIDEARGELGKTAIKPNGA
jgi:hypothetical protein